MAYNRSGSYWSRNADELWPKQGTSSNEAWRNGNNSARSNSNWDNSTRHTLLNEISSNPVTQVNLANDILKLVFQNSNQSQPFSTPVKSNVPYGMQASGSSFQPPKNDYSRGINTMPPLTSMEDMYEPPSPWARDTNFKSPLSDPYTRRQRDFGSSFQSPTLNRSWGANYSMSPRRQVDSGDRNYSAVDNRYRRDTKYQSGFVPNKLRQNFKKNRSKAKIIQGRGIALMENPSSTKTLANSKNLNKNKPGKSNKTPQSKSSSDENTTVSNSGASANTQSSVKGDASKTGKPKTLEVTISQTQTGRFVNKGTITKKDLEQGLYCHICKIAFGKKMQSFKMHIASKYHTKNISRTATKYSKELSTLRSNMKIFYSLDSSEENSENKEKYDCKGCTVWFPDREKLNEHMITRQHQLLTSYYVSPTCKLCKETFSNRIQYDKHLLSVPHIIKINHHLRSTKGDKKEILAELQPSINIEEELFSQGMFDNSDVPEWDQDYIVGSECLKPVSGWWCQVCHQFVNSEGIEAFESHCKSQKHYKKFVYGLKVKYVKEGVLEFGPRVRHVSKRPAAETSKVKSESMNTDQQNTVPKEIKDENESLALDSTSPVNSQPISDNFYHDESTNMFENDMECITSGIEKPLNGLSDQSAVMNSTLCDDSVPNDPDVTPISVEGSAAPPSEVHGPAFANVNPTSEKADASIDCPENVNADLASSKVDDSAVVNVVGESNSSGNLNEASG